MTTRTLFCLVNIFLFGVKLLLNRYDHQLYALFQLKCINKFVKYEAFEKPFEKNIERTKREKKRHENIQIHFLHFERRSESIVCVYTVAISLYLYWIENIEVITVVLVFKQYKIIQSKWMLFCRCVTFSKKLPNTNEPAVYHAKIIKKSANISSTFEISDEYEMPFVVTV